MKMYTATDGRIIVKYWGNQNYDFYQLRWSRADREEKQVKPPGSGSRGGWWAFDNAWENTLHVQGAGLYLAFCVRTARTGRS